MPIKIGKVTEQEIRKIPFKGVVSYSEIIDYIKEELIKRHINVIESSYRATTTGDAITGILTIKKEENMMDQVICFSHGYNNLSKFRCSVGLNFQSTYIIGEEPSMLKRRSSDPDTYKKEIFSQIDLVLDSMNSEIISIENDTDILNKYYIKPYITHEVIGELYLNSNLLNTTQISVLKTQFNDTGYQSNMFDLLSLVSECVSDTHPREWFITQQKIFDYFRNKTIELEKFNENFIPLESIKKVVPYEQVGTSVPSVIFM